MKYNSKNQPLVCMMTNSTCYKGTRKMDVKGVLIHCTGAPNPNLKRYVQPSETDINYKALLAKIGTNTNKNDLNHIYREMGMNAWIGKLADGSVTTVQTMPWDYRPWGCASGSKGSCNNGWIQFEMCEPTDLTDKTYFAAVYNEMIELVAYLCQLYNLDPKGKATCGSVTNVPVILCHQDSYKLGLGSNHSDIYNWFDKFGKTMDDIRNDVYKLLHPTTTSTTTTTGTMYRIRKSWADAASQIGAYSSLENAKAACNKAGSAYSVFDASGKVVYTPKPAFKEYKVKITALGLYIWKAADKNHGRNGMVYKNQVYTIVEEKNGFGKLKSGAGWIDLNYTKKV